MVNMYISGFINGRTMNLCSYERDLESEKMYLKKSRLEIKLRNLLEAGKSEMIFPSACACLPRQLDFQLLFDFSLALDMPSFIGKWNYNCFKQYFAIMPHNYRPTISCDLYSDTPFQIIRLYGVINQIPLNYGNRRQKSCGMVYPLPPGWHENEEVVTDFLAPRFGLSDQLICENADKDGTWKQTHVDEHELCKRQIEHIPFRRADGSYCYSLIRGQDSWGKCTLLPVVFYAKKNFAPLMLNDMPCEKLSLYNEDVMSMYPGAGIYLTDELAIPVCNNNDKDHVFSCYYGGNDALAHTDFSALKGRHVIWLLFRKKDEKDTACYARAMKIAAHLYSQGIEMDFLELADCCWEETLSNSIRHAKFTGDTLVSFYKFILKVKSLGYFLPEIFRKDRFNNMSREDLEKEKVKPFLMDSFIREASYALMYGGTGSAKTWFALSIAHCLAIGDNIFSDRWATQNKDGIKVLYVAGEMYSGEINERLLKICPNPRIKHNFVFNRVANLKIDTDEGQAELIKMIEAANKYQAPAGNPVKLLVLDNLTVLTQAGENPSGFSKVFELFERIKAMGIAILLCHHENAEGQFRGSTKILDMADIERHLYKVNRDDDMISVIVGSGKKRSIANTEGTVFKATLDLSVAEPVWQTESLNEEDFALIGETKALTPNSGQGKRTKANLVPWHLLTDKMKLREVILQRLEDCSNEEIAVNLGTSESTVASFRKNHCILDENIKKAVNEIEKDFHAAHSNASPKVNSLFEYVIKHIEQ